MTRAIAAAIALLFALLQASAMPLVFLDPIATPSLPIALIAAWAIAREPREVAPALLLAGIVLGVLSAERVGWFVLALVPAAAVAIPLEPLLSRPEGAPPRWLVAGAVAGLAVVIYTTLLAVVGGAAIEVSAAGDALLAAALITAVLTVPMAAVLARTRARKVGLFA